MAEVVGLGHMSFTVMDLQKTLGFYCGLLGGKVLSETIDETPDLARNCMGDIAENPYGKLKVAMVELAGIEVEFLQYLVPETTPFHGDPSRAGSAHIAVNVDDIDAVYKMLKEKGVRFHSEVNECVRDGKLVWKWVYARDPDGICCEIIQRFDGR